MPDLPILLCTDQVLEPGGEFDLVRMIASPRHFFRDKIAPLMETPFERTLFLDTDTFVCSPVADAFEILDRYDLALAHAPLRHDRPFSTPNCFAELNTGVIAYRRGEGFNRLVRRWLEIYDAEIGRCGQVSDQAAFRQALWESDARAYVLPPEYNFRTVFPGSVGRGRVRIIHGRHRDMATIERLLNRSRGCRVVLPGDREWTPDRLVVLSGGIRFLAAPIQWLVGQGFRFHASLATVRRRWGP